MLVLVLLKQTVVRLKW